MDCVLTQATIQKRIVHLREVKDGKRSKRSVCGMSWTDRESWRWVKNLYKGDSLSPLRR